MELSVSELLLYGGIVIMVVTALIGVFLTILFLHRGKKLKHKLEQEYGKPQRKTR